MGVVAGSEWKDIAMWRRWDLVLGVISLSGGEKREDGEHKRIIQMVTVIFLKLN